MDGVSLLNVGKPGGVGARDEDALRRRPSSLIDPRRQVAVETRQAHDLTPAGITPAFQAPSVVPALAGNLVGEDGRQERRSTSGGEPRVRPLVLELENAVHQEQRGNVHSVSSTETAVGVRDVVAENDQERDVVAIENVRAPSLVADDGKREPPAKRCNMVVLLARQNQDDPLAEGLGGMNGRAQFTAAGGLGWHCQSSANRRLGALTASSC